MKKTRQSKLTYIVVAAVVVIAAVVVARRSDRPDPASAENESAPLGAAVNNTAVKVKVVRSPTCGCCGQYISYLKRNGFDVETEFETDDSARRNRYGVPDNLGSCHTTFVGGYVIEGHVPVEAISKLLEEKPSVRGIALPGMPAGSPGMPGKKRGDFDIRSFGDEAGDTEFMRL